MKKYYFKNGKEVKLGEPLRVFEETDSAVYSFKTSSLNETDLKELVEMGIIDEREIRKDKNELEIHDIIEFIGKQMFNGYFTDDIENNVIEYLSYLPEEILFKYYLYAISRLLDSYYDDHIKDCDIQVFYVLSSTTGKVVLIDKNKINSYKSVCLFRSLEDIKIATRILRPYIKKIWPDE